MKQKFTVTGMTCSACSAHVDKAVRKLEVEDFPLTVILDSHGGDLYESGPAAYLASRDEA